MEKVQFTAYSDPQFNQKLGKPLEVQINPDTLRLEKGIRYQQNKRMGTSAHSLPFEGYSEETLSFQIMLDGTGIVAEKEDKNRDATVYDRVSQLENLLYSYQGSIHRPAYVQIVWGAFLFKGQLKSMDTHYQIFSENGNPVRATIDFAFSGFLSDKEQRSRDARSSPDMSHRVIFKEGDTLSALCHEIYENSLLAPEVAKINGLDGFRNIQAGTELLFPRLTTNSKHS